MKPLLFFLNTRNFSAYHRREEILQYANAYDARGERVIAFLQPRMFIRSLFHKSSKDQASESYTEHSSFSIHSLWSLVPLSIAEKSRFLMWLFVYLPVCWQIKKLIKSKPYAWFYRPEQLGYIPKESIRIFLQYDHYAADMNSRGAANISKLIDDCIESSLVTLVSSYRLYDEYSTKYRNCVHYPNAISEAMIERVDSENQVEKHSELVTIGFVGNMDQSFDTQFVLNVVQANPDKSFVFVGPKNTDGLSAISDCLNVKMVGRVDYSELTCYINSFDMCLCPYKQDEFSRYRNPLKVYEYLAHNKPVVTTPCDLPPNILSRVKVVSSSDECNVLVGDKEFYKKPFTQEELSEFHSENSWFARVKLFMKAIKGNS